MSICRPDIVVNIGEKDLTVLSGIDIFYNKGEVVLTEKDGLDPEDLYFLDDQCIKLYFESPEAIDKFKEILDSVKSQLESYLCLSMTDRYVKFSEEGQSIYDNISRI